MSNNSEKQNKNSSLSGFRRAVPIILGALALLIAVFLLTKGAGAFGNGIRSLFLGSLSYGAYAIPLLLAIHALCYASDSQNGKTGARVGFSVTTLAVIPVIEYAIATLNSEAVFAPVKFFTEQSCGGFFGSIIGFCLVQLVGSIGVFIICAAVLAVYATFFFADKTGAYGRAAMAFASKLASLLTKVDEKIQDNNEKHRIIKEEQEQLQREIASEELADDEFFRPHGAPGDVKVRALGIDEESSPSGASPLMEHKIEEVVQPAPVEKPAPRKRASKPLDLTYGIEETEEEPLEEVVEEPVEEVKTFTNHELGLDDSPENVFTKDFDPFDFATSEKMASKPSSKATPIEEELDDLTLYEMRANHEPTEREKRMMELERRKRAYMSKKNTEKSEAESSTEAKPAEAAAPAAAEVKVEAPAPTPAPAVTEPIPEVKPEPTAPIHTQTFENSVPEKVNAYTSYTTTKTTYTAPIESLDKTDAPGGDSTEDVAILIGQRIAQSNPAYARSANEMRTFTKVKAEPGEDIFAPAPAEPAPAEPIFESIPAFQTEPQVITFGQEDTPSGSGMEFFSDVAQPTYAPAAPAYTPAAPTYAPETPAYAPAAPAYVPETPTVSHAAPSVPMTPQDELAAILAGFNGEMAPEPQFKPYTPPVAEAVQPQPVREESTLKVERSMLSPTPETISFQPEIQRVEQPAPTVQYAPVAQPVVQPIAQPVAQPVAQPIAQPVAQPIVQPVAQPVAQPIVQPVVETASAPEFTLTPVDEAVSFAPVAETPSQNAVEEEIVWTSEEETDEIDVVEEEETPDFTDEDEEFDDEDDLGEEIPPEEQNPDVIKMREMFPFLTPLDQQKPVKDSAPEEDEDVDDVPFDDPTPAKKPATSASSALTGLVAMDDVKEEKKKKKADYSNYVFPSIDILASEESAYDENIQTEIQENADKLIETLASFGVTASIKGVDRGPRITRYEVVPAKGVKVSSILNLQDDIALNLAAGSIRMEAPIPGKSAVGIEIPNKKSSIVRLRNLLETEDFKASKSKTIVCIGRDVAGQPVFGDISKMPHLLIAGATGMGKSVCINSLLISVLYKARPDEVKLIMIDPKQVEFTMYNGIPHLLVPVVSDPKQAAGSLMWAVEEMERRYNLLNPLCVRNIDAYNEKVAADPSLGDPMPRIIIVIDEFADLMLQVKDPVETLVMRIAQKARAAGIYLVIGTQRPSVNVITGVIKANVPSRISCKVMSNVDSKTVLDSAGAEKLLDRGDALYAPAGSPKPHRVQCAFVSDSEVEAIMAHLKQFSDGSNYDSAVMEEIERAAQKCSKKGGGSNERDEDEDRGGGEGYLNDPQFLDAVEVAVNTRKISTSLIQRKLSIGYGKAAKFIDIMEDMGIVGEPNGSRPREVLLTPDEWREKLARVTYD